MKILGFAGVPASSTTAEVWREYLLGALQSAAQTDIRNFAENGFVATLHGPGSVLAEQAGCLSVVRGEPRWIGPVLADGHQTSSGHAGLIAAAYRQYGDDFLSHLRGSFALALVDVRRRRVLLAIDPMGIERMAYTVTGDALGFGSSAEQLARSPLCRFGLVQQGLYDFFMMHMIPAPNTVFTGVSKLRPGTAAIFEQGQLRIHRYWRPQFVESGGDKFAVLKSDLHDSLDAAVRSCDPDGSTGAFLSGGLDSSTVAGKLAKVNSPARTFSMGFGVDAYDELHYARIAAQRFKCNPYEYHVTPDDIVTAFPLIAGAYDEPFGNSSAVPTYMCALRAREQGTTHLLAGDGGDEIFGGNDRYAGQKVFELYQRLPALLRKALLEPVSRLFPSEGGLMPLRKFRSYVDQARIPLPERLEAWNFIYRNGTESMLEPEFAAGIDPRAPFRVMDEVYHAAPSDNMLHQMLYYDWHFTLSDNDLRKVGTMCELAGVKVSYPMLDHRVVDLSLRVPPQQKIAGTELRSFYKKAMTGFLPMEILNKTKHGFGLPFGLWLKTHVPLRELIYSHLHDLKKRHIVKAAFIDRLIDDHRSGHASFFGYAIWDLAMLEAWLQQHG